MPKRTLRDLFLDVGVGAAKGYVEGSKADTPELGFASGGLSGFDTARSLGEERRKAALAERERLLKEDRRVKLNKKIFGLQDEGDFDFEDANQAATALLNRDKYLAEQEKNRLEERKRASEEKTGKQIPAAQVVSVSGGASVGRLLPSIKKTIQDNKDMFGPIEGRLRKLNPYDTRAQGVEAEMRAASQAFGRFMEGGVLRKEDEAKYRLMFPQLNDTEATALKKLEIVNEILSKQYSATKGSLGGSGYDVSGFEELPDLSSGDIPAFKTVEEAEASGYKGEAIIGGRKAVIE